ncbi:MAG: mechanosensitive ion channel family protein [Candidatus Woesearchaeota archaeon]
MSNGLEGLINIIFSTVIAYLIISLVFSYLRSVIIKFYLLKHNLKSNHYDNFIVGIKRLSFFFNHFIFALVFVNIIGIRILEVLTALSLVAVAFVLIFKDYIANFLNGIIIMFSKNLKLDEYVKIGEYKGRIKDVSFISVELHTEAGEIVYIPNTNVISKEFTNFSKKKTKTFKCEFTAPKLSKKELNEIEKKLTNAISKKSISKKVSSSNLGIEKISKDSFELSYNITTTNYRFEVEKEIRKIINIEIIEFLDKIEKPKKDTKSKK